MTAPAPALATGRLIERYSRAGRMPIRPIRLVSDVLVTALFVMVVASAVLVGSGDWAARPILSGSMRPALPVGALALTERVPVNSLQQGDIVVVRVPDSSSALRIHRIATITRTAGITTITTKGDRNPVADAGSLALRGHWAYRVAHAIPLLGYPAMWLHTDTGTGAMVAAGLMLLLIGGYLLVRVRRIGSEPGVGA